VRAARGLLFCRPPCAWPISTRACRHPYPLSARSSSWSMTPRTCARSSTTCSPPRDAWSGRPPRESGHCGSWSGAVPTS
jgi:hypothetical protein